MTTESWGRYPRVNAREISLVDIDAPLPAERPLLPHGLGRSYGDVCLVDHGTHLLTRSCRRILAIDEAAGTLTCEAGASLDEILDVVVPLGWFPPVVPGTRFITVGGAIANDVHGKNHHIAGTFGASVLSFELRRTTGEVQFCSSADNPELFRATIGGLGLTGVITRATFKLARISSPAIQRESIPFGSVEEFIARSNESASTPYIVGWIDCLAPRKHRGRGVLFLGDHAPDSSQSDARPGDSQQVTKPRRLPPIPFAAPSWLLNRGTAYAFNTLYRLSHSRHSEDLVHYEPFFFPLDAIPHWNLLYGKRGFLQWQCVVPRNHGAASVNEILAALSRSGHDSYLGVIKLFGDVPSPGLLSFPRPGVTLAIDLPIRGPRTFAVLNDLDTIVADAGGAIYAAKDARMSPDMFRLSNPRLEEFMRFRDPGLRSHLWDRLLGVDAP